MTLLKKKEAGEKKPLTAAQKKKKKQKQRAWLRAGLQIAFFLLTPSMFTSAFSGVKYIFQRIGNGEPLEAVSFLWTLATLCVLTMVLGRFFCGYVCAFGSLGDGVQFVSQKLQKKLKKKLPPMPEKVYRKLEYLPFVVLFLIVLLTALGVYGSLGGWSPWDVFSMVTSLNFRLSNYVLGAVLLVLIILGMAWEPRFFCRFLCPMGAVFRLLPILPWAVLRRNREQCLKGCSACTKTCPVKLELAAGQNAANCIRCGKCTGVCPKSNITWGIPKLGQYDIPATVGKAVIFVIAAGLLGCLRFV